MVIHWIINHPWPLAIVASRVLTVTDANLVMKSRKNPSLEGKRSYKLGNGPLLLRKLVRTGIEEKSSDLVGHIMRKAVNNGYTLQHLLTPFCMPETVLTVYVDYFPSLSPAPYSALPPMFSALS